MTVGSLEAQAGCYFTMGANLFYHNVVQINPSVSPLRYSADTLIQSQTMKNNAMSSASYLNC